MDIKKLQLAVFERTGVRIDETDPVFAVVALNEALLGELIAAYQRAAEKNNVELNEKIGGLVEIHRSIIAASRDLAERANQAHMAAALKAAAEARAEIMNSAREAISTELTKVASIVANTAHQLAIAGEKVKANTTRSWTIAIVQAVIGGIVAGMVVLVSLQFQH
jgi:uncharacterized protein YicC (UPF0701 family)